MGSREFLRRHSPFARDGHHRLARRISRRVIHQYFLLSSRAVLFRGPKKKTSLLSLPAFILFCRPDDPSSREPGERHKTGFWHPLQRDDPRDVGRHSRFSCHRRRELQRTPVLDISFAKPTKDAGQILHLRFRLRLLWRCHDPVAAVWGGRYLSDWKFGGSDLRDDPDLRHISIQIIGYSNRNKKNRSIFMLYLYFVLIVHLGNLWAK